MAQLPPSWLAHHDASLTNGCDEVWHIEEAKRVGVTRVNPGATGTPALPSLFTIPYIHLQIWLHPPTMLV